ncbi:RnfH family protein [Polaromonas sp.]|uniref:RnfH family protein n=1 Tax=Polaromonas sp. TaxID=1869339 RepID=UPI003BA87971
MKVSLFYSPAPRQVHEWVLGLPSGSTVAQALAQSPVFGEFPDLQSRPLTLGVWGKRTGLNHILHENDRLEIYRGLRVDPKIARRERFSRQGAKRAGLFSATRAGGKAGY